MAIKSIDDKNLHTGHRQRMKKKVMSSVDLMEEHELLEVLLYEVQPRMDTNPLAHKLLRMFGSLKGVLSASPSDLMVVDGVGEKIASYLAVCGKIFERTNKIENNNERNSGVWDTVEKVNNHVTEIFDGVHEEILVVVLLSNKYKMLTKLTFQNRSSLFVQGDASEIAKALAVHKARFVLIAHNHPSNNLSPSTEDDIATKRINDLCESQGVTLTDHIIVGNNKTYSYFIEGRLNAIKTTSVEELRNNEFRINY